jgi:Ferritin-like
MSIDTREELINALHEACEIEHGLLVQYLYAALSLKKGLDEGLTPPQQRLVRAWEARILAIAREEMGHLGIVCNLLAAIGGPAKLGRPAMPRRTGYYPFPFDLLPFGDDALYKFLVFELPRGFPLPPPPGADPDALVPVPMIIGAVVPEPLTYEFVGELYAKIADGFRAIPEAELFIGPTMAQTANNWSDPLLDIQTVTEQRFAAARPVPKNPATRADPRADSEVTLIKHPTALRLTELCNASYGVMLLMLQHYFSLAPQMGDAAARASRRAQQAAAQRIMSIAVRPLAEEVTKAPLDDPQAPERAGPSFEVYSEVTLSPYPEARWILLLERLGAIVAECGELAGEQPRVGAIGETLAILREDLAASAVGAP